MAHDLPAGLLDGLDGGEPPAVVSGAADADDDRPAGGPTSGSAGASPLIDEQFREGARRMLAEALQAEADDDIARFVDERDGQGRRLVVRNGTHQPRDEHKLCLLVMIGVRADGRKELVALADGYRESGVMDRPAARLRPTLHGRILARGRRRRARVLGRAARGVPDTREQRCWFRKIANVLGAATGASISATASGPALAFGGSSVRSVTNGRRRDDVGVVMDLGLRYEVGAADAVGSRCAARSAG